MLPQSALDGEILARSDSAGASHDFADARRETRLRFLGYAIEVRVREAILALDDADWRPALDTDGELGEGAVGHRADRPGQPRKLARGNAADLPARAPPPRRAAHLTRLTNRN